MNHTRIFKILAVLFAVVLCFGPVGLADPIGTAFTYQGRLIDTNQPAHGSYDFQFKLFDANSGGNKLGADVNQPEVNVIDGYFTVELDFGSAFDGNNRWLEIGVRPGVQNDQNIYTTLSPRQKVTPAPYAVYALGGGGGSGSLWQVNGTSIYYNNGNIGIGTTGPNYKLDVNGNVNATAYYGDGSHLTGTSAGFGAWASKSTNTVYQAATDGFVLAGLTGDNMYVNGLSDSFNPPTTVRIQDQCYNASNKQAGITMPVRKNDYWEVTTNGSTYVWWIPLGN